MPCYSPLKGYKDADTGGLTFRKENGTEKMEVACSQCLGCRADRARHWAMRIVHESTLHLDSCFVTLTYRSKEECTPEQLEKRLHVPDDWSLNHAHVQKFLKRLRNKGHKIRYYMCGEYGSKCIHGYDLEYYPHDSCKVGRPHYHLCIFGMVPRLTDTAGEGLYYSDELDEIWKYGLTSVGELNFQTAAYVSRYVLKKVNGLQQEDHYQRTDLDTGEVIQLEPEYARMSLRPGIGADWFDKYSDDVFRTGPGIPVPGHGIVHGSPRFYDKLLERTDPKLYEKVKEERTKYIQENKDEFTPQRLMAKYKVALANHKLFSKEETL